MKRGGQRRPLADRDDPTRAGLGSDDLDALARLLHPGSPDEHGPELGPGHAGERDVALERIHLAAERVPADGHVDPAERLLPCDSVFNAIGQIVVDSPPGITSPSTSSSSPGLRTGTGREPAARRAARCSATSPCSASTPTAGPCAEARGRAAFRETVTRYHSSLTQIEPFSSSPRLPA